MTLASDAALKFSALGVSMSQSLDAAETFLGLEVGPDGSIEKGIVGGGSITDEVLVVGVDGSVLFEVTAGSGKLVKPSLLSLELVSILICCVF